MDTPPDQINAELLFELMKFEAVRTGNTEQHERLYFQTLLMDRFAQKDCALQHLAARNSEHVGGWCTFAVVCLNIENQACRSKEVLGHFHSIVIDAALLKVHPGVSHELDRIRSFKVQLFRRLKEKGLSREEIENESPSIRKMLHQDGMLMASICADYHTREQITANVIETVAESVVKPLRSEVKLAESDDVTGNSILPLVQRIAKAMATSNGDPILSDTQIISETTGPTLSQGEAGKSPRSAVSVDSKGNRYFSHVRTDGKAQIDIESPHGITTTLKFWPPEAYLNEAPRHQATAANNAWRYSPDTHRELSVAGIVLIFTFIYHLFPGRGVRSFWPFLTESLVMITYCVFGGILVRALFGKMRIHFLVAVIITLLIFVGWFIGYRAMTSGSYSPTFLLPAAMYFCFRFLRSHHTIDLHKR
jgi:hypothetical protein